ncbi:2-amino-4-hydroxy-6- hydroxymethyldihydropteridine [Candidatus Phycorickettsia trachydisci]|uniref:2-amino-4-hydroxy-6-hydroxymethyldihydropteridine pyrophosphokinase n=1 Tax=Candidatus Phycorickettsia trachydisci TaxID=2115978 RepID=A0A2P1P792_9RICK|nr:2-amino-4-hydroxy-6-hydroxymethyldihydropteridine diphosphokinase [Candidatus Phycorickettsia trachydisci]AVP87133.1 2-amino-4-hydroxy-6- hydroxymethyldihydropteridine [Candidatus Phycorickettsia trachydisci]
MKVFIGLGSNLGNKRQNCLNAINLLSSVLSIKQIKCSRFYSSKALTENKDGGPDFINAVISCDAYQGPYELLWGLKFIETQIGRANSGQRWSPRIIDLDILFMDDLILESDRLTIPHNQMHLRDFVLRPLCDLAPSKKHPILGLSCFDLNRVLQISYVTNTMQAE